ncbi:MAG: hypothetical protein QOK15_691 [Nocardioidaceae bacterium]|nr:hypothetical protein [Nocardioidaceae bacterium]
MSLTVEPPAPDGTSQVILMGRHMVDGSRWKIDLGAEHTKRFRRTAHGGSWTVGTQVNFHGGDEVAFSQAIRVGTRPTDEIHGCSLINARVHPAAGGALCHRGFDVMITRRLDDGTVVVRYLYAQGAPHQLWHVDVRATDSTRSQEVAFTAKANRRGVLRTRTEFDGAFVHPHLKAIATNGAGRSCRLRVNPADVDGSPLTARQLVQGRLDLN